MRRKVCSGNLLGAAVLIVCTVACGPSEYGSGGSSIASPADIAKPTSAPAPAPAEPELPEQITPEGLVYRDVRLGHGALAESGKTVKVHYVGTLTDGREFDTSRDRGRAFEFQIDRAQVIRGWDIGVTGMRVGGVRRLRVPPDLGYGDNGAGTKIPPRATLIFEIELLDVLR